MDPTSTVPMIGASGAIAGVLGAYLVLYPHSRVLTLVPIFFLIELIEVPAVFFLGFWFVMQLFSAGAIAVTANSSNGGIAFVAHQRGRKPRLWVANRPAKPGGTGGTLGPWRLLEPGPNQPLCLFDHWFEPEG